MHRIVVAIVLLPCCVGISSVRMRGGLVTGAPSEEHRAIRQYMEIVEAEECPASVQGKTLRVPERCEYLRGLYRYVFTEEGSDEKKQALVEFSVTRAGARSHAAMVLEPIVVRESTAPPPASP